MRVDHEEIILRNPALGACAFWYLSRAFSDGAGGRPPELPYFVLAAGMLFHRATVDKVCRMQYDSGLLKAISERPDIVTGLQRRMQDYARASLLALQIGATSGLLQREGGIGFPTFRAVGSDLPKAIRHSSSSVADIMNSAKRLGAWFATQRAESTYKQLSIEF
jgi:hypothetical protein